MRPPPSLALRLLGGGALLVILALAGTGAVLSVLSRAQVGELFRRELIDHLDELTAQIELGPDGALALKHALSDPRFERPYGGRYWQLDLDGSTGLRSRSLWDRSLPASSEPAVLGALVPHQVDLPGIGRVQVIERRVRFAAAPERTIRAAVALPVAEMTALTARFDHMLALTLALLGLVLLLGSAVQVRVGLQPLRHLARAVAAVRRGATGRVEGDFPSEVMPVVAALDQVLDQRAATTARAQAQAADLAHGLKTSLQVLLMQADELLATGETRGEAMRHELLRLQALVAHQLARARAHGPALQAGGTPLAESVAALVRVIEPLAAGRGLAIACAVPLRHRFAGDARDLEEMLGNLLDNACKWARRRIGVASRLEGDRLLLSVEDDGPGIAPAARAAVFDRGRRLDEQQPGHGLGLAIVRELAELYGGAVTLAPATLGGLRVELCLPAASEAEGSAD
ncbi:MAG: ATP-binding protein [Geminicoccaceae bacterium]